MLSRQMDFLENMFTKEILPFISHRMLRHDRLVKPEEYKPVFLLWLPWKRTALPPDYPAAFVVFGGPADCLDAFSLPICDSNTDCVSCEET